MWYKRDFSIDRAAAGALPIKVLKGPRQVGKTTLLAHAARYRPIYFDDLSVRQRAQENPRFFFDQSTGPLLLDEAALAPEVFPELKRRVDAHRRGEGPPVDVWITGSNQTLLQHNVRESLAGRASYFDLNTLSVHELGARFSLPRMMLRGGWPELHVNDALDPTRYLNDLIATFIEKDIIAAAGVEKKSAFMRVVQLVAGRVGQLFNAADIARNVGVNLTTVQSWCEILEQNGIFRCVQPFHSNRSQRLIKAPKYYLEDVGLAARLQGWTDYEPLMVGPMFGALIENLVLGELSRFFINRAETPRIDFVRTKDQVEIDFIVHLQNQRAIAIEVKSTAQRFTAQQDKVVAGLALDVVERWVVACEDSPPLPGCKALTLTTLWEALDRLA